MLHYDQAAARTPAECVVYSPFDAVEDTPLAFLRRRIPMVMALNTAIALMIAMLARSWDEVIPSLVAANCIGMIILLLLSLARFTLMRRYRGSVAMRYGVYIALIAAGAVAGELLAELILPHRFNKHAHDWYTWVIAIVFSLVAGSIAGFINFGWVKLAQRKRDLERAERAAIEAQLRALQAQIEPHFLFNTLANLDALIAVDPPEARLLLANLIRYLRAALTHARSTVATLATEIELLKAYLSIMALRLPNRLVMEFDCDPECLQLKFPAMLLQPLVENAITHGIEPACEGGTVRISVHCHEGMLTLSVDDSGIGLGKAQNAGTGSGIQNIRDRLRSLFGDSARLILEPKAPCGTHASIEVPLSILSETRMDEHWV